jgi:hypothetical protein
MNRLSLTAFDERMQVPTGGTTVTEVTSVAHAVVLGMFDQVAFIVTSEQLSGNDAALGVKLQHSADGRNWLDKPGSTNVPGNRGLDPGSQNVVVGFDDGIIPSLRMVRFALTLSGTGPLNVAVRLDVTLNDVREGTFAIKMRKQLLQQANSDPCSSTIQGGKPIPGSMWGNPAFQALVSEQADGTVTGPLAKMFVVDRHGNYTLAPNAQICMGVDGVFTINTESQSYTISAPAAGGPDGSSSGTTC